MEGCLCRTLGFCLTLAMARFRYVIADVFTDTPLAGNQLAVFTDARDIPDDELQRIAREMNLSETTFVYPPDADGHVRMRIFTPSAELPFAGHPTLGTAFVLAAPLQLVEIKLETARGTVAVELERDGARIVFGAVGINCFAGEGLRWKTRMFGIGLGMTEDPATGSAAGPLALHLARYGRIAFGDEIEIVQGVEVGRPSTLYARVDGSAEAIERVEVGGSAVVVARGELQL
jgi:trans-2,3-dihydro-3-hydroxyanthranilate isomerase